MPNLQNFLIIGANLTGGRAAETLRERGFDGRVILVGAEPDRPYERPPLSKGVLQGTYSPDKAFLRPPGYYTDNDIALRLGVRATGLSPKDRVVTLETGERLPYNKLLIATGTQVRRLDVPGADLAGIHYLRTIRNAERIAAELQHAQRVVVVGAGFIGLEVAASARMLGREVTVVEVAPIPLVRALGPEMGEVCAAIHRERGVLLKLGVGVQEFRGAGRVEQVVLSTGEAIPCDLVVAGVGVTPAVDWLAGSGLALDNGILVNEYTETNLPDVYGAGDVAHWWHPRLGERLRVEHYDNAQNQGVAAALAMLGGRELYAPVPYFWSDQYEFMLQYVGHARGQERLVMRGNVAERSFTAFYVEGDRIKAAFSIGRPREVMAARRLIHAQQVVDPAALADVGTDLRKLLS